MKMLNKYRYEISALLLAVGFFTIALYLNVAEPESEIVRVLLLLSLISDGVLFYFTLRKLWRTKWKTKVSESFQKVFEKLARALMSFLEKWNIRRDKDQNILSGKTTVSFDFSLSEAREPKPKRTLKWKHLQTDRERIRYLYRRMISERVKRGVSVCAHETPLELKQRGENNAQENELFDLYIDVRYDDRVEPNGQTVLKLKEDLFGNLK